MNRLSTAAAVVVVGAAAVVLRRVTPWPPRLDRPGFRITTRGDRGGLFDLLLGLQMLHEHRLYRVRRGVAFYAADGYTAEQVVEILGEILPLHSADTVVERLR